MANKTAFYKLVFSNPNAKMAIPNTAQLVVIRGKILLKYGIMEGLIFNIISSIYTSDAITNIKVMVRK